MTTVTSLQVFKGPLANQNPLRSSNPLGGHFRGTRKWLPDGFSEKNRFLCVFYHVSTSFWRTIHSCYRCSKCSDLSEVFCRFVFERPRSLWKTKHFQTRTFRTERLIRIAVKVGYQSDVFSEVSIVLAFTI